MAIDMQTYQKYPVNGNGNGEQARPPPSLYHPPPTQRCAAPRVQHTIYNVRASHSVIDDNRELLLGMPRWKPEAPLASLHRWREEFRNNGKTNGDVSSFSNGAHRYKADNDYADVHTMSHYSDWVHTREQEQCEFYDESNTLRWKPDTNCTLKSTSKFEGHNEHVKLMPFDFTNEEYDGQHDPQYFWPNKLFIGGISPITTTDVLKGHFSRYGKVVDCVVMQKNGRPRGFGFVTFQDSEAADQVVMEPQVLDGRMVDVKRAIPEQCQSLAHGLSMEAKIFVGGLGQTVSSEILALYFSNFGPVADAVVMRDKATTRSRGFGFVRFGAGEEGQNAMEQVLSKYLDHRLEGKWIEVKKATPPGLSPPPKERSDAHAPVSTFVPEDEKKSDSKDPWGMDVGKCAELTDVQWPQSRLDEFISRVPSPSRQKSSFSREDFLALELSTACAQSIFG